MYKKVLIISDNYGLCAKLKNIFIGYRNSGFEFTFSISPYSSKSDFEKHLNEVVKVFDLKNESHIEEIISNFNLILSVHCKQIFPVSLIENVKCINIHPGYNPINRGWYPQVFAIIKDLQIGATIHEIDAELDHGEIIAREFVDKSISDTSGSLYNKIIAKEIELVEKHIASILNNTYTTIKPEGEGNLFLKKDFWELCQLDLNDSMTTLQFINRLRALTHGDFKNAFFIDPESGKKTFVSINLEQES